MSATACLYIHKLLSIPRHVALAGATDIGGTAFHLISLILHMNVNVLSLLDTMSVLLFPTVYAAPP